MELPIFGHHQEDMQCMFLKTEHELHEWTRITQIKKSVLVSEIREKNFLALPDYTDLHRCKLLLTPT